MSNAIANLLTVILPLKGRLSYTKRWLKYYDSQSISLNVIIADGGDPDGTENYIRDFIATGTKLNIRYIRFPYDKEYADYYRKMLVCIEAVATKYVALADNDDFFVIDSLLRSIDYLENHADYISARGTVVPFSIIDTKKYFYKSSKKRDKQISNSTPLERLSFHLQNYEITFYDVTRTSIMKRQYELLTALLPRDLILAEIFLTSLSAIYGKIARLDDIYIYRQRHLSERISSNTLEQLLKGDISDRILDGPWASDFQRMVDYLTGEIKTSQPHLDRADIKNVVISAYISYVSYDLVRALLKRNTARRGYLDKFFALCASVCSAILMRNNGSVAGFISECIKRFNLKTSSRNRVLDEFLRKQ